MKSIKNKKLYYYYIGWTLFILATGSLVSYLFQGSRLFSSFSYYLKFASFGWAYGFAFWFGNGTIGRYAEKKLDKSKNPKKTTIIGISLLLIYGIIISVSLPYIFDRFFWDMAQEDIFLDVLIKSLMVMFLDSVVIAIYYSTQLSNHWMKSIKKNEELKRENLQAKYEVLKNKVNPHFLFNCLNTLSSVIERKPELGSDFVKKLSDIYRYVLEQSDKELVSLDVEMKFVKDYIFLSKIRFGNALTFHSTIPENKNIQVVPLGLQTLIENAIKHNIISDDMPLQIELGIEDNFIVVKNNIQKKNIIMPDRKPHGLENLRNRFTYHSDLPIEITESDDFFTVRLPIIKTRGHEVFDN
ncbi:sensor histidine kinase [Saccharicrinis sp. FJH2]|uniref:sensor histidine kinase n=1 Tax=Saccharicrinis sp. FJH65 TaxID=3344659 RepID=UPI0035F3C416